MEKDKVIITGAKGQLGSSLVNMLKTKKSKIGEVPKFYDNLKILAFSSKEFDITNSESVLKVVQEEKPYAIINCAAYTDVDGCEDNVKKAFLVNALGARNLAIACEKENVKLIHISTDYVFEGEEKTAKIEGDIINPQNIYGKSKALGEMYVQNFCKRWFILRTSWVYGEHGNNFVKTIIKAAREKGVLNVVDDQIGTPTNVLDLSFAILKLAITEEYGIYHCSGEGQCSWYEFACEIIKCFNIDAKINGCSTDKFKRKAKRPKFSVLENLMLKTTIGEFVRDWKEALEEFAKENIENF